MFLVQLSGCELPNSIKKINLIKNKIIVSLGYRNHTVKNKNNRENNNNKYCWFI